MKISLKKTQKVQEQILSLLYHKFPQSLFTSNIAEEIARDEEFVKKLLLDLKQKNMLVLIDKNNKGKKFKKRQRWRLSNRAQEIYSQKVAF